MALAMALFAMLSLIRRLPKMVKERAVSDGLLMLKGWLVKEGSSDTQYVPGMRCCKRTTCMYCSPPIVCTSVPAERTMVSTLLASILISFSRQVSGEAVDQVNVRSDKPLAPNPICT